MSDMTAAVAQQMEAQTTRAATGAAQQGIKATVAVSGASARISAHVASRSAGGTVRALIAVIEAARMVGTKNRTEGQVGLKTFTRITDGKREILPIDEREVAVELARELRKHGVTFAIERHKDGSRTFHVEGKDASVVEHALDRASARIDERVARRAEKREDDPLTTDSPDLEHEEQDVEFQLDEPQTTEMADTLSTDYPELAEEVRQRHSVVMTPATAAALDATVTTATTFAMLPESVQEHLLAARAAEPSDLSLTNAQSLDLPAPSDAEIVLQLDRNEQASLVAALRLSVEPPNLTLTDQQRTKLTAVLRTAADEIAATDISAGHESAATRRYDQLNDLADHIDGTSELVLDRQAAGTLRSVFDTHDAPAELEIVESRARTYTDVIPRSELAEQIESQGVVALGPTTVETLHAAFGEQVWTRRDNDHMGWVVGAVNQQHERRSEDAAALGAPPDAPDRAVGDHSSSEPHAADLPTQGSDEESPTISRRDATREKVAQKIDAKSVDIKRERAKTKTRTRTRSPKATR